MPVLSTGSDRLGTDIYSCLSISSTGTNFELVDDQKAKLSEKALVFCLKHMEKGRGWFIMEYVRLLTTRAHCTLPN